MAEQEEWALEVGIRLARDAQTVVNILGWVRSSFSQTQQMWLKTTQKKY